MPKQDIKNRAFEAAKLIASRIHEADMKNCIETCSLTQECSKCRGNAGECWNHVIEVFTNIIFGYFE